MTFFEGEGTKLGEGTADVDFQARDTRRRACARDRRATSWKSFLFNLVFEYKRLSRKFGSGSMYENVAPHASSPVYPKNLVAFDF